MQFRLLGQLEVVDDRGGLIPLGGLKQRAVLAALLTHPNQPVSKARLAEWLWPTGPPPSASHTIEVYASRLRHLLSDGGTQLTAGAGGYWLRVRTGALDTDRLESLIARADREAHDHPELAAATLDSALRLFRGPVLGDLAEFDFAVPEVVRLENIRLVLIERRAELQLGSGNAADLTGSLEARVSEHPTRERLWELLMLAYCREGNQAAALNAYARARGYLAEELGIDPGPALADLHLRVLRQDPGLPCPPPPRPGRQPDSGPPGRAPTPGRILRIAIAALCLTALLLPGSRQPSRTGDEVLLADTTTGAVIARLPAVRALQMWHADGLFWILRGNSEGQAVSLLGVDESSGAIAREFASPYGDVGFVLALPDALWVTDYQHPEVARIDPRTGMVVDRITFGGGPEPQFRGTSTGGEQVVLGGGHLWIGRTGEVVKIDPVERRVVHRFALPYEWGLIANGDRVWICLQDGVTWIDVRTGEQGPVASIIRPQNLVAVGDGVWATDPYGHVYAVNAAGRAHLRSTDDSTTTLQTVRNGSAVWLANGTSTVVATDLGTAEERAYRFGNPVQAIAVGERTLLVGTLEESRADRPASSAATDPDERVLRMAWARSTGDPLDPALVDPAANPWHAQLARLACAQLMRVEPDARGPSLVPDLAEGPPVVSPDGLTYRFVVRGDRVFAPPASRPVTARDVVFSIERAMAAAPLGTSPAAKTLRRVRGAAALLDRRTRHLAGLSSAGNVVTVRLSSPQPDLPWRLAMTDLCVVPEGSPAPSGLVLPPAGAGAYYFTAHENGGRTVLRRNPNHRGRTALDADSIVVDESQSPASSSTAAADGRLQHVAYDDPAFTPSTLGLRSATEGALSYRAGKLLSVHYLAFNAGRRPFNEPGSRRAVVAALDRAALAAIRGGVPSNGLLPHGIFERSDTDSLPDVSGTPLRSRRVLGLGFQRGCGQCAAVADQVADQLRSLGLVVRAVPLDEVTGVSLLRSDVDLVLGQTRLPYPDPATFLVTMLGTDVPDAWLPPGVVTEASGLAGRSGDARVRDALRLAEEWARDAPVAVYATGVMGELLSGLTCPDQVDTGTGLELVQCTLE